MTLPHRSHPCAVCPARRDNAHNPASKFPAVKWLDLTKFVSDGRGGSAGPGAILFGCHKGAPGSPERDLLCAGAAVAFGHHSLEVRLAVARGHLPREFLVPDHPGRANWPELYTDWAEMVEAQMWHPGDPADHLDATCSTPSAKRAAKMITAETLLKALPRMLGHVVVRQRPTAEALEFAREAGR